MPAGDWSGKPILVVYAHETSRRVLLTQLRELGLKSLAVKTLQEAIALLRDRHFDFVVVDLNAIDSELAVLKSADTNTVDLAGQLQELELVSRNKIILCSYSGALPGKPFRYQRTNTPNAFLKKPVTLHRLKDVLVRLYGGVSAAPQSGAPVEDSAMATQLPLRILLAEDNLVNQKVAVRLLKHMGYRPDVVSNGMEALAAVHRQPYDLILMDVQMPGMDGLEAARSITATCAKDERPRIIALTANAVNDARQQCLDAGMDDYLSKPIDLLHLQAALLKCSTRQVPQNSVSR